MMTGKGPPFGYQHNREVLSQWLRSMELMDRGSGRTTWQLGHLRVGDKFVVSTRASAEHVSRLIIRHYPVLGDPRRIIRLLPFVYNKTFFAQKGLVIVDHECRIPPRLAEEIMVHNNRVK